MSRFYAYDIKLALKTKLDAEFNTMIATIRTERSDSSIPDANNITFTTLTYNYPEITIDVDGESEILPEILNDNIDIEPEIYPVRINAIIMTQANAINNYADFYNEAFERILHGCTITGFTWCRVVKTRSQELVDENMQTFKSCGVDLQIRIN